MTVPVIDPLEGLYLEDSHFLGMTAEGNALRLKVLFALLTTHRCYTHPKQGEQHCYREGSIAFGEARILDWQAGNPIVLTDPDGSHDFGSIEVLQRDGNYRVVTEWFVVLLEARSISVILDQVTS